MYVKAFSIRLHHAAQRHWHEVHSEFKGSEPRVRGNIGEAQKNMGNRCRDHGVQLIQSSSRSDMKTQGRWELGKWTSSRTCKCKGETIDASDSETDYFRNCG